MAGICSIEGCDRPVVARGWCRKHYTRWDKHGDPLHTALGFERGEPSLWVLAHVRYTDGSCLSWPFSRHRDGRGQVTYEGKDHQAHRLMCFLAHGEPPTPKHEAAHSCGKGHEGCVNPKHLRWATRKENAADAIDHGTVARGSRTGRAQLTEESVREIRRRYREGADSYAALAKSYGVSTGTVGAAVRGDTWAWL